MSAMGAGHQPIAIVDDDEAVRRALRRVALSLSYDAVTYSSGPDFLEGLDSAEASCVLLDLHMPGLKGLDVLNVLRERGSSLPVIIITGFDQAGMREKCLKAGAACYLIKPIERSDIASAIEIAIAQISREARGDH